MSIYQIANFFKAPIANEYKFVGDNSAYIQTNDILIPEFDDWSIKIEVLVSQITDRSSFIDQYAVGVTGRTYIGLDSGGVIRFFNSAAAFNGTTVLNIGQKYRLKYERVGTVVNGYIDDILEASTTIGVNAILQQNTRLLHGTTNDFKDECFNIDIEGNVFTFSPPSTINSSGGTIATVQNDDGNRIQSV